MSSNKVVTNLVPVGVVGDLQPVDLVEQQQRRQVLAATHREHLRAEQLEPAAALQPREAIVHTETLHGELLLDDHSQVLERLEVGRTELGWLVVDHAYRADKMRHRGRRWGS